MVRQMLFLDAPAHTRMRSLAAQAFTPRRVAELRQHIQEIADTLLDAVVARGRMDVIQDLAAPLPAIVTAEMLGVPTADHPQLKAWSADFAEMLGNFQHNPDRAARVLRSTEDMIDYFRAAVREQRTRPRPGLVERAAAGRDRRRPLDRGRGDRQLHHHHGRRPGDDHQPDRQRRARRCSAIPTSSSDCDESPALIASAVEELLRYESPSQHTARLAPEDTVLGGQQIRRRQAVIAVMAAGNRDPERFPDPDRLDLARPDNRHLAFGWAAHFCFGAPLARLEGQIAVSTVLRRLAALRLETSTLEWRTNLGLRGLTGLPITFTPGSSRTASPRRRLGGSHESRSSRAPDASPMAPVSFAQRQLWLHAHLGRTSPSITSRSRSTTPAAWTSAPSSVA